MDPQVTWNELLTAYRERDPDRIEEAGVAAMDQPVSTAPLYGDGNAGEMIVERLLAGVAIEKTGTASRS